MLSQLLPRRIEVHCAMGLEKCSLLAKGRRGFELIGQSRDGHGGTHSWQMRQTRMGGPRDEHESTQTK